MSTISNPALTAPIIKIFNKLQQHNGRIYLEDGKLKLDAPKGGVPSELMADLKLHKEAIISYLNVIDSDSQNAEVDVIPIFSEKEKSYAPVSFSQQRLWLINQLEPEGYEYNIPLSIVLKGDLSIEAFEWSIEKVVQRHEVLRSSYLEKDG